MRGAGITKNRLASETAERVAHDTVRPMADPDHGEHPVIEYAAYVNPKPRLERYSPLGLLSIASALSGTLGIWVVDTIAKPPGFATDYYMYPIT